MPQSVFRSFCWFEAANDSCFYHTAKRSKMSHGVQIASSFTFVVLITPMQFTSLWLVSFCCTMFCFSMERAYKLCISKGNQLGSVLKTKGILLSNYVVPTQVNYRGQKYIFVCCLMSNTSICIKKGIKVKRKEKFMLLLYGYLLWREYQQLGPGNEIWFHIKL